MRTSHLSIRRRIENEKLKITDEQLFASPEFACYLTDIAEAAAKRYKRTIKVVTYWDDSEDSDLADTDNKRIRINAGNPITQSFPTRKLRADSLVGLNGHEVGHLLFTDFKMLNLYMNAFSAGGFYPEEPKKLPPLLQNHLDEIKQLYSNHDEAAIGVIAMVAHNLANVIEDVYIESRMCDTFSGTFRTGILLNNIRICERSLSIKEQIDKENPPLFLIINLISQYLLSGDINNLGHYTGEYLDVLNDCIPILDDAVCDDDTRVRYRAANQIVLILWNYIKEMIEQVKKKKAAGDGTTKELIEALTGSLNSMTEKAPIPDRNGKAVPCKKKQKHKKPSNDSVNTELQAAVSYETGRIGLEKTTEIGKGGNGGISYNHDYTGSGYAPQAEKDMLRILNQMAEEQAIAHYEEELEASLQAEANRIDYGNAHKNVHITVNRISYVDDSLKKSYASVSPPLLLLSKRLQDKVATVLKDKEEGGKQSHLLLGRRIDPKSLVNNDGYIFYDNKLPNDKPLLAVALLIDESGSMSSNDRITKAREAAIIIHDFCRALKIPIIVYGHSSSGRDVDLYAYSEFDSLDGNDAFRIMDMSSHGCNRDGAALRFVAERLMTRPESTKLLILISDGQPSACDYEGTAAEADLRGIKLEYTRKGITMFAAAIGDDKPNIQRIYKDGFLDITNLNELPYQLTRLISSYIDHAA